LAAKARVKGNLYYKLIEMHLGALVEGQLVHEIGGDTTNVHRLEVDTASE